MKELFLKHLEMIEAMRTNNGEIKHPTIEGFVLKHGRYFDPVPLPKNIRKGKAKQCFKNAALLALQKDLIYCEGYAIPACIQLPLEHAWCITKDGKVVDNTWSDGKGYYGIPMKREFVLDTLERTKIYGILNNYTERWPIFKSPVSDFLESLDLEVEF